MNHVLFFTRHESQKLSVFETAQKLKNRRFFQMEDVHEELAIIKFK